MIRKKHRVTVTRKVVVDVTVWGQDDAHVKAQAKKAAHVYTMSAKTSEEIQRDLAALQAVVDPSNGSAEVTEEIDDAADFGLTQPDINALFKLFDGWSDIVRLKFRQDRDTYSCNHTPPRLLVPWGQHSSSSQADVVPVIQTEVPLRRVGGLAYKRELRCGKCPKCAKLYWR